MRVSGGALAGFLVAVALALLAWTARNDAQTQQHKSKSKEFAAEANLKRADDPEGAVALAMDARREDSHGAEADGALRSALVQAPRALIERGTSELHSAVFSPNGRLVLDRGGRQRDSDRVAPIAEHQACASTGHRGAILKQRSARTEGSSSPPTTIRLPESGTLPRAG